MDGQAGFLEDQILPDVFGFESGVTTEGWSSLVLYYDHINSIPRSTQLLFISCFASVGYLVPIDPRSSII